MDETRAFVSNPVDATLRAFVRESRFVDRGAVITDLDGTAVIERAGRVAIPPPVQYALKRLRQQGRPVILNTLRFPLSVLRTFGEEWLRLTGAKIPAVTLNGSLIGYVSQTGGRMLFEEMIAFPLTAAEIDEVLSGVARLVDAQLDDLLVFHYPRDWRQGEHVWTPNAESLIAVREKYKTASDVAADRFDAFASRLHAEQPCMIALLIDIPEDRLMVYQHAQRSSFFTHAGVDKRSGALEIARRLSVSLQDSVGAGDTELDVFLSAVGLALHVGTTELAFKGVRGTLRLDDPMELGDVLFRLADLQLARR